MSGHTPGPWHLVEQPVSSLALTPIFASTPLGESVIGYASGAHGDGSEKEANARLIAAAPELLALAREMVTVIEGHPKRNPFQMIGDLKATIAKAEGRHP